jgi:hypothetical protein
MNTVNRMLLAQYLHDDGALNRAKKQWQEWRDYTRQFGIHEFNSPTYCATDLSSLTYGILYVQDPTVHRQMIEAAEYLWTDIASMYLMGVQHVAGAHSRDYQFLSGRGSLDMNFYLEGLFTPPKEDDFTDLYLEKVSVLENERPGGYHPSQLMLNLIQLKERIVEQRFDADEDRMRYTYLTQDFAIGTADGSYNAQDKMFAADLVGKNIPVTISVVPDANDSPYGKEKVADKNGHNKPVHMPPNLSAVQDKGLALLVFDLNPQQAEGGNSFATDLVLPAHPDRLVLDGHALQTSGSMHVDAHLDSVIGVRMQKGCFAARVFQVDSFDGQAPTLELKSDRGGWDSGAIRFVVQHSAGPVRDAKSSHLHVSMLVEASTCDNDALDTSMERLRSAETRVAEKGDNFTVKATVGARQLELTEDEGKRLPVSRKVNGVEMGHPVFLLNGVSIPFDQGTGR